MKLRLLLVFGSFISISACTQTTTLKNDIRNDLTNRHIKIVGTKLSLVPPLKYKTSESFVGIQKGDNVRVQIIELLNVNYFTNSATLILKDLENFGANILEYQELKINGFSAFYVVSQMDSFSFAQLVFGDSTFSTLVLCNYLDKDTLVSQEIQMIINSIYYDKDIIIDSFTHASFTIDEHESIFKLQTSTSGVFLYTINGKTIQDSELEPRFAIRDIPFQDRMSARGFSINLMSNFKHLGIEIDEEFNLKDTNINGIEISESELYCKWNEKYCIIFQQIIVNRVSQKVIQLRAIVKPDEEFILEEIKKVTKTIRFK